MANYHVATSFRCAALELMIYGAVLHGERNLSEVFNILVHYDPNIFATINTAFDNFLGKFYSHKRSS